MFIFLFHFPDSSTSERAHLHMRVRGAKINQALTFACDFALILCYRMLQRKESLSARAVNHNLPRINEFPPIARTLFSKAFFFQWFSPTLQLLPSPAYSEGMPR